MSIIRGIKFYDIYAKGGVPVANPALGVTVETWGSRSVAVLTLREDGNVFAENWDSGYSISSDAKSHPRQPSVNGGKIKLIKSQWWSDFISAGFSLDGCRAVKTWDGESDQYSFTVSDISIGITDITLTLTNVYETMGNSLTVGQEPFVVGDWKGVELTRQGSEEIPLFGGMSFRTFGGYTSFVDFAGSPIQFNFEMIPIDTNFSGNIVFPTDSYCRISAGIGEDSVMRIESQTISPTDSVNVGAGKVYKVTMFNDFGMQFDDDNITGVATDLSGLITDISAYEFFQLSQVFLKDSNSTVEKLFVEGVGTSGFVNKGSTVYLTNQFGVSNVKYANWVQNSSANIGLDIRNTLIPTLGTTLLTWAGHYIYKNEQTVTYDSTGTVDDRDHSTYESMKTADYCCMTYFVDNPDAETTAIAIDSVLSVFSEQPTQTALVANFYAFAEFKPNGIWAGQHRLEELTFENPEYVFRFPSGTPANEYLLANIDGEYFNPKVDNWQNNPTDNRIEETSEPKRVFRGSNMLKFVNTDAIRAKPNRLYFAVSVTLDIDGVPVGGVELKINELALFGDVQSGFKAVDNVTADIVGRDCITVSDSITELAIRLNWDSFSGKVVNQSNPDSTPVKRYLREQSELEARNALEEILRESWQIGYMNRAGEYYTVPVHGILGKDITVGSDYRFVVPRVGLKGDQSGYTLKDVPCFGIIKYNGVNQISIQNVDADSYSAEYVTGVSNSTTAELLWNKCNLIWKNTGVLLEFRSDISELKWIYTESDAIEYVERLLEWNGSDGTGFLRQVLTVSFEIPNIIRSELMPWNIGDACKCYIPNVTKSGDYSGVITGIEFDGQELNATITARVAQINSNTDRIIEVGLNNTSDRIVETETATDNIIETGV